MRWPGCRAFGLGRAQPRTPARSFDPRRPIHDGGVFVLLIQSTCIAIWLIRNWLISTIRAGPPPGIRASTRSGRWTVSQRRSFAYGRNFRPFVLGLELAA